MDRRTIAEPARVRRNRGQIREGFRFAWRDRRIRALLAALSIAIAFSYNWSVLLPLLVIDDMHRSEGAYAFMAALLSLGALLGTLWLAPRRFSAVRLTALASVGLGVASLVLGVAESLLVIGICSFWLGAFGLVLFTAGTVGVQQRSSPELRGRVMAVFSVFVLGSPAVGVPLAGWSADNLGIRWTIAVGGLIAIVTGVIAGTSGLHPED
jgi:MFS family permease